MKAKFRCNGKMMTGEVKTMNTLTCWIKVQFKKKITETIEEKIQEIIKPYDRIIKRHKVKHAVVFMGE
jgi:hypothetical protein